jgi:hypothetical protein
LSVTHISADLRRLVVERADGLCEYCLVHKQDTVFGCEIDHIISEKHGGRTVADNLALACLTCNRNKGSDIASLVPGESGLSRLFHPRTDRWSDHFHLHNSDGVTLAPLTPVAEATIRVLRLNDGSRLLERQALLELGRYPTPAAQRRMAGVG